MALKTTKVNVLVSYEVELRFDPEESLKEFPDSLWPVEEFAESLVKQQKLETVLQSCKSQEVIGVRL